MKSKVYRGIRISRPKPDKNKHVHDTNYQPSDDSGNILLAIEQHLKIQNIIREIPRAIMKICVVPTVNDALTVAKRLVSLVAKIPLTPDEARTSLKARIEALK